MSGHSRITCRVAVPAVCLLALVGAWVGADPVVPQHVDSKPVVSDVVMLDELVDRYQPVAFEHKAHAEMAEMWDGCVTCHHKSPKAGAKTNAPGAHAQTNHTQDEADAIPACKSCHPADGKDADIRMPSLKGAYHRQCLNCHKAWAGENNCTVCHEARNGDGATAKPTPGDVIGRMHPPTPAPKEKQFTARYMPAAGALVTFRHDEHVERFGIKCVACHRRDACANCHDAEQKKHGPKPVNPAISWKQSHDPCIACHNNQSCDHCHHTTPDKASPRFQHEMTGLSLDGDHRGLVCRDCHADTFYTEAPTCGDARCHKKRVMAYPKDTPGRRIKPTLPRVLRQTGMLSKRIPAASDQTGTTQTIADHLSELPIQREAPAMTTIDRPTRKTATCTEDGCHAAVVTYKHVHGPVGAGACDVCHKLVDEKAHRFAVVRQSKELCTYCHRFDVEKMPVVHKPIERGECLGCHNPHGGRDRSMTREDSTPLLCNRCHEAVTTHRAFLHTPVTQGQCVACHSPHASRFANLLDAAGPDLCLTCHDEFGQQLGDVKVVHKALKEGCTKCHDVHGSSFANVLTSPAPTLCLECHKDTAKQIADAKRSHKPVLDDPACLTCHTPHGGNVDALMRDRSAVVCQSCHDKPVAADDDRQVPAVEHVLQEGFTQHGPIGEGECRGCHTPHGGDRTNLLVADYATDAYATFDVKQFALCFRCHDAKLATRTVFEVGEQPTTGFRNGPTNLHALHVNQRYGRTCRVCHDTHTGQGARLVRQDVSMGQWNTTLTFLRTETGGRCSASCHLPFAYDRENPVDLPSQREVNEQMMRVRAEPEAQSLIQWTGKDIAGKPVEIPHAKRPTLLLLIRADSAGADAEAIKALRGHTPGLDQVQVVVMVHGDLAAQRIGPLAKAADPAWQITQQTAEQTIDVEAVASPMALVIRADGRILTRTGGKPRTLAFTIGTYLDLALGRAVPTQRVVNGHDGASDHAGVEPAQYLRTARKLLAAGDIKRAEQTLREAMTLHPQATELQVAMAGVLIDKGNPAQAIELIEQLPADAIAPADRLVLTARARIALEQWDSAEQAVQQAFRLSADYRDAHYLMGLIHQHRGDWQAAAESFKAAHKPTP